MHISSNFDSGNIQVIDASDATNVRLTIEKDNNSDHFHWFHFRVVGVRDVDCVFSIVNAGMSTFAEGWEVYRACASYDRETWFRVHTAYDGKTLTIHHRPEADSVYYANFAPYSMERLRTLLSHCQLSRRCRLEVLGTTLDGQELEMVVVGETDSEKRRCWIVAGQHPGETQGVWWAEGFLQRLLDEYDPLAREVLKKAVLYLVPNINPDGSCRGNLRTNAAGLDINRQWQQPSMERSPEISLVRRRMLETGVDLCIDVHGDEIAQYVYMERAEMIPANTERRTHLQGQFELALMHANPDFQNERRYPRESAGLIEFDTTPETCVAYVGNTFDALAVLIEMPFNDYDAASDAFFGWSPARSKKLGAASLDAIYAVLDDLR